MARHPGRSLRLLAALPGVLLASSATVHAELIEDTLALPVVLPRADGTALRQTMQVTLMRESTRRQAPFAVLLHGRPTDAATFPRIGRQRYPVSGSWLVAQGYAVLIPTRVGYGHTGGPDLEYTGECQDKQPAPGLAVVVSEVRQLLAQKTALRGVDPRRGVVIGESFGGFAALAVGAARLPGVRGVINVAGGDGGGFSHLDHPCRPDRLQAAFAAYGGERPLPSLWLYSRNDRLWGPQLPHDWFAAFQASGGGGRFVDLPADGANGHFIFSHNAAAWQPAVADFLRELGLPVHDRGR